MGRIRLGLEFPKNSAILLSEHLFLFPWIRICGKNGEASLGLWLCLKKSGTKMDPWQVETWTKTCGLVLLVNFEPGTLRVALEGKW